MRSWSRLSGAAMGLTALVLSGCAFEDGDPWGQAELSLNARFAPEAGRLEGDRLRTNSDYLIELDTLEVEFEALTLRLGAEGGALTFDPANPPPQYSLCHNGHCHHEDGRLVDYEDIQVELAEAGGGGPVITQAMEEAPLALSETPAAVGIGPCSGDCQLPRGTLASIELRVGTLRVAGQVFDRLEGDRQRLDAPVHFDLLIPIGQGLSQPLSGVVGKDQPVRVRIEGEFDAPARLFDGLDWAAFDTSEADDGSLRVSTGQVDLTSTIQQNLMDFSEFSITLSR